jgi:hypothetical protein
MFRKSQFLFLGFLFLPTLEHSDISAERGKSLTIVLTLPNKPFEFLSPWDWYCSECWNDIMDTELEEEAKEKDLNFYVEDNAAI